MLEESCLKGLYMNKFRIFKQSTKFVIFFFRDYVIFYISLVIG